MEIDEQQVMGYEASRKHKDDFKKDKVETE